MTSGQFTWDIDTRGIMCCNFRALSRLLIRVSRHVSDIPVPVSEMNKIKVDCIKRV